MPGFLSSTPSGLIRLTRRLHSASLYDTECLGRLNPDGGSILQVTNIRTEHRLSNGTLSIVQLSKFRNMKAGQQYTHEKKKRNGVKELFLPTDY
jgi:hypothetical protein